MKLADKGVLVTGGASGLGAACVRMLVENGAKVVIADLNRAGGEDLVVELSAKGASVFFVQTDVTSEEEVQAAIGGVLEKCGALHILLNCAGIGPAQKVIGKSGVHSLAAFQKVIAINLIGTFNATRLAVASMIENEPGLDGERGVVLNTASIAAFDGQVGQAAYAASKGGIVGMTLPLAREVARYGIRVMTIAPGTLDTPLLTGLSETALASLSQQIPFPSRLGRPDEYAALAKHILENVMLNGEVIRLDGGLRMASH